MKITPLPDYATASRLLEYFSEDGRLVWRPRVVGVDTQRDNWNSRYAGTEAGYVSRAGYRLISIHKQPCMAHRLAWLLFYRQEPVLHIDHIDGDGLNNAIENLREATVSQNLANSRLPARSTSGLKGAYWHAGAGRWMASIMKGQKHIYLGLYDTAEAAHEAYVAKAVELFGEFARAA